MEDLFNIVDIEKALNINEHNLEREMSTCPSYYFRYAMLAVDAEQIEEKFIIIREAYEASIAVRLKRADPKGAMKEADLKRECHEDDHWQELNDKVLIHHNYVRKLKAASAAFDMKSKMLMSLNRRDLFKRSQGTSGDTPYHEDY
jgi:hypothetical protein